MVFLCPGTKMSCLLTLIPLKPLGSFPEAKRSTKNAFYWSCSVKSSPTGSTSMDRSCRLIHYGGKGLESSSGRFTGRAWTEAGRIRGDAGLQPGPDGLLLTEDKPTAGEVYSGKHWWKPGNFIQGVLKGRTGLSTSKSINCQGIKL